MKTWHWAKQKSNPIGLDIGADSIKLLQISDDAQPQLIAAAGASFPDDIGDGYAAREAFVLEVVPDLIQKGGFKGNRIVFAIPITQMHLQHLRLNRSENGNYDLQIEAELRKKMSVDPSRLVIRNIEVGEIFHDGSARQEIICMATPRSIIMKMIGMASKVHLQAVGLHSQPLAITKAFEHLFRRDVDQQKTTLFIDIGHGMTKAMITHGSKMIFAKTIQVAGKQIVSRANDTNLVEAGTPQSINETPLNRSTDGMAMLDTAMDLEKGDGDSDSAVLSEMTDENNESHVEMLDCLIDELQLCIGYHNSVHPKRAIDKLIFLGGVSNDRSLCQRIAAGLGISAQLGDPLARVGKLDNVTSSVGVDLEQPQPGWTVPLGLCLLPTNL